MRRILGALVALVVVAGCGGGSESGGKEGGAATQGKIEVVSFYPEGAPDYENMQGIDKGFAAAYPGSSAELVFGGGQNAPNIEARWRANNPPEVNVGFFAGFPDEQRKYADAGQVQDLTAAMNEPLKGQSGSWKDSILPSVLPYITDPTSKKIYAIPRELTVINFFYNKKLFADAGVKVPTTWPEFLTACQKLKATGVAPLAVTGTFPAYMQTYFDYLLLRHSGDQPVIDAIEGKREFGSIPGVQEAAADLEELVKSGAFADGFKGTDFTAAQLNFFRGNTAMILMGSWLVSEMQKSIPSDFQLGTFLFPTVPGAQGDQDGVFGQVNSLTVASKSKKPAVGVDYLRYFSRKDVQQKRVEDLDYISGFRGVDPPEYSKEAVAKLDGGARFAPTYMTVMGRDKAIQDAFQQPIVGLFFGKIGADEMVQQISENLAKATS